MAGVAEVRWRDHGARAWSGRAGIMRGQTPRANFACVMAVGREPGAPAGKHRAARGGEPPRVMRVPRGRA